MKLESVKMSYSQEMHTCGPEVPNSFDTSLLEIRTETPDGNGHYCVINATEIAFDDEEEVDAFAQKIKDFIKEFCK
jgi:hypothetical protein